VPQQHQVATKTIAIDTTIIIILHLIEIKIKIDHTIDQNDHIIEVAITIAENVIMSVFSAKSETNKRLLQARAVVIVRLLKVRAIA
jgi:hypothetical protein